MYTFKLIQYIIVIHLCYDIIKEKKIIIIKYLNNTFIY